MTTTGDLARAQAAIELHARQLVQNVGTVQHSAAGIDRVMAARDSMDHQTRVTVQDIAPGLVAALIRMINEEER